MKLIELDKVIEVIKKYEYLIKDDVGDSSRYLLVVDSDIKCLPILDLDDKVKKIDEEINRKRNNKFYDFADQIIGLEKAKQILQAKELEHKHGIERCSLYAEIGKLQELLKEAVGYVEDCEDFAEDCQYDCDYMDYSETENCKVKNAEAFKSKISGVLK